MRIRISKLLIILVMVALFSCKSNSNIEDNGDENINYSKEFNKIIRDPDVVEQNITFEPREDIFSKLTSKNYINSNDLLDVIGVRIAKKAEEKRTEMHLLANEKTREIKEAKIECFNAKFHVTLLEEDTLSYEVNIQKPILPGGSVYQVLTDLGMNGEEVGFYTWKIGEYIDPTAINAGDTLIVDYCIDQYNDKHFEKFSYKRDRASLHEFYIEGPKELRYNLVSYPYTIEERYITGIITKQAPSLDQAMKADGIEAYVRQQVNDAIESQVDMRSDPRVGDTYEILIQEKWVQGEKEPHGKVMFAQYTGQRIGTKNAYRFIDEDDDSAYNGMYLENGKGLVQGNYRTPLNKMHITSPFGYRIHPILGKRRMHDGIDLRGRMGTNVYAVSNGVVIKAANTGDGYGKDVRIRHDNGMMTQYAHLSRINTRVGRRVNKGQIIGKVGSTGRSTGPHLHFGVQMSGRWVNPKTNLKMVAAAKLKGARKTKYLEQVKELKTRIQEKKQEFLASNPEKRFVS